MDNPFIYSLGISLLHSLWQFTLLYLLLRLILLYLKQSSPNFRYWLSFSFLFAGLLISVVSFISIYHSEKELHNQIFNTSSLIRPELLSYFAEQEKAVTNSEFNPASLLPWLVISYFTGLIFFALRFTGSLLVLRNFRKSALIHTDQRLEACFKKLINKLGVSQKIKIRESLKVKVPILIGYLKPVVLVPAGIFLQLPYEQTEAVLLHEIAHIKRRDYLLNILQSMIEILFFYHPAVYLISAIIRSERENCCDDIALFYCKNSTVYARALASIESILPLNTYNAVALGNNKMNLLNRITRILKPNKMRTKLTDKIIAGIIILVGFTTIILTGAASINHRTGDSGEMPVTPPVLQLNDLTYSVESDSIIEFDSGKVTTVRENKKGKEEQVEMTFEEGKLTKLVIDGKTIPEKDYRKYKNIVSETKAEVKKANAEVERAERELKSIDIEEVEREVHEALEEARAINKEEIQMEIEEALAEIDEAHLNVDSLRYEIQKAMESVNWDEIHEEIEQGLREAEISEKEIQIALDEAAQAMDEINWDEIGESINEGVNIALESVEAINWDIIRESIELSLDVTADVLHEIHTEVEKEISAGKNIREDLERSKKELKDNKKKLSDLESEMEKALEELEEEHN